MSRIAIDSLLIKNIEQTYWNPKYKILNPGNNISETVVVCPHVPFTRGSVC